MKHFAILEMDNEDCPIAGVITNVNPNDKNSFKHRLYDVINTHFDVDEFNHDEIPDIFTNEPFYEIGIEIDGLNYTIRIIETWIY